MGILSKISIGFILIGAVIMLIGLIYRLNSFQIFKSLDTAELRVLKRYNLVHNILMVFFLFGYFIVALAIYTQVDVISELFVSIIFLFGAIFVFLGIKLHSTMNKMLDKRYMLANKAAVDLKNEQDELIKANQRLAVEVKERKKAEIIASENEKRHKQILEHLPVGVLIIDGVTLKIKEANPTAQNLIGQDKDLILNCHCQTYVCSARKGNCPMQLDPLREKYQGEHTLIQPDGTKIPIIKTVSRIEYEGEAHFLEVFVDISDKKNLEKQLQRSQKMEAMGALAGAVAHDLNNILSGLLSYPELILMRVDETDPLRKPLETIRRSGEMAAVIVQDLLSLARQNVEVKEPVNLSSALGEYLESPEYRMLQASSPGVKFETESTGDQLIVEGSPVHITKIIMNLVSNAAEAISGEGRVRVSLEKRHLDSPLPGYDSIVIDDYVVLSVEDNGTGIPPQDIARIFEPFYSRKVMGHSGSGLGMAIVLSTVESHNGYIVVESILGEGTTFEVYFPASRKSKKRQEDHGEQVFHKGKGKRILLVDDVEEQREIATSMLEHLEYCVETAASGEEAILKLQGNNYDLVLLDMIMEPGMDGVETYINILKINKEQKVIPVSGYSTPEQVHTLNELGLNRYIKKPYSLKVLAESIHYILDNPSK